MVPCALRNLGTQADLVIHPFSHSDPLTILRKPIQNIRVEENFLCDNEPVSSPLPHHRNVYKLSSSSC